MREILFRGKTEKGEWLYGGYVKCNNREYILPDIDLVGREWVFKHIEVIPETVGQFTGLTDKNGTKIFEGDIIGYEGDSDMRFSFEKYHGIYRVEGIVRYGNFNCSCCDGVFGWYVEGGDIRGFECHTSLEVIGNIHDNPEILMENV